MHKVLMFCAVAALAIIVASFVFLQANLWRERSTNGALELRLAELESETSHLRESSLRERHRVASERRELVRLRGEVTQLREQLEQARANGAALEERLARSSSSNGAGQGSPPRPAQAEPEFAIDQVFLNLDRELRPEDEAVRLQIREKEEQLRVWWQAFLAFAEQNDGHLPATFADAASFLPSGFQNRLDLANFDTLASGRGAKLGSMDRPNRTIIAREISPLALSDGLVCKVYLMGDGSVQLFEE